MGTPSASFLLVRQALPTMEAWPRFDPDPRVRAYAR